MITFILKGVDFKNPRLTRNPRIWFQYLCWCADMWMMDHKPIYPDWFRMWAFKHYDAKRHHISWQMVRNWQYINPDFNLKDHPDCRPLPWYIGFAALGPLYFVWPKIDRVLFRSHTGGRSHRCEFTDKQNGALYGGNDGPYMDRLFEQFIENIDTEAGA